MKIFRAVFEKVVVLLFAAHLKGPYYLEVPSVSINGPKM
jgi:hypothetical protein